MKSTRRKEEKAAGGRMRRLFARSVLLTVDFLLFRKDFQTSVCRSQVRQKNTDHDWRRFCSANRERIVFLRRIQVIAQLRFRPVGPGFVNCWPVGPKHSNSAFGSKAFIFCDTTPRLRFDWVAGEARAVAFESLTAWRSRVQSRDSAGPFCRGAVQAGPARQSLFSSRNA